MDINFDVSPIDNDHAFIRRNSVISIILAIIAHAERERIPNTGENGGMWLFDNIMAINALVLVWNGNAFTQNVRPRYCYTTLIQIGQAVIHIHLYLECDSLSAMYVSLIIDNNTDFIIGMAHAHDDQYIVNYFKYPLNLTTKDVGCV